jgi:DNA mismatch repair protein MutH
MESKIDDNQALNVADNYTIIEEVNNRPLLWNPANEEHKNSKKVSENWSKIADLLSNED